MESNGLLSIAEEKELTELSNKWRKSLSHLKEDVSNVQYRDRLLHNLRLMDRGIKELKLDFTLAYLVDAGVSKIGDLFENDFSTLRKIKSIGPARTTDIFDSLAKLGFFAVKSKFNNNFSVMEINKSLLTERSKTCIDKLNQLKRQQVIRGGLVNHLSPLLYYRPCASIADVKYSYNHVLQNYISFYGNDEAVLSIVDRPFYNEMSNLAVTHAVSSVSWYKKVVR